MSVQKWEHFFKPEVRTSGQAFVRQGKVTVQQLSDIEIQSYVRASAAFKVIFKSTSVESDTVLADCNCPLSKKGQFCKHIWATLLVVADKKPDFLEGKRVLEKKAHDKESEKDKAKPLSQEKIASQEAYKQKQNDYRKEQYQKQKARLKEQKQSKKSSRTHQPDFPPEVEQALKYFLENGFPLKENLTAESVSAAMKKLARIFHPDVGGSHEEILELNKYAELLTKFSKS